MSSPPEVRLLTPDDWRVLSEIRLRSLADSPEAFGSTLAREQGFDEGEWRRRLVTPVAVVSVDGVAVAIGGTFPRDGVLQVWGMWTGPAHRGRGHACAVLDRLLAGVGAETHVQLHVNLANHAARSVYQRYGFVGTGRHESLRPGSDQQMELMILEIYPLGGA